MISHKGVGLTEVSAFQDIVSSVAQHLSFLARLISATIWYGITEANLGRDRQREWSISDCSIVEILFPKHSRRVAQKIIIISHACPSEVQAMISEKGNLCDKPRCQHHKVCLVLKLLPNKCPNAAIRAHRRIASAARTSPISSPPLGYPLIYASCPRMALALTFRSPRIAWGHGLRAAIDPKQIPSHIVLSNRRSIGRTRPNLLVQLILLEAFRTLPVYVLAMLKMRPLTGESWSLIVWQTY